NLYDPLRLLAGLHIAHTIDKRPIIAHVRPGTGIAFVEASCRSVSSRRRQTDVAHVLIWIRRLSCAPGVGMTPCDGRVGPAEPISTRRSLMTRTRSWSRWFVVGI